MARIDDEAGVQARLAGGLYLVVVATGLFAFSIFSDVIVAGDPSATNANLAASEARFRLGIASDLVATMAYVAVVALLYGLLRPVSRVMSLLAAAFGLAGCIVSAALSLTRLAALTAASDGSAAINSAMHSAAWLHLNTQALSLSFAFFGTYCVMLGWLVFHSTFLPRILGILLAIAGVAWLTDSFGSLIAPDAMRPLGPVFMAVGGIGELAFALWITVFGVDRAKWRASAEAGP